MASSHKKQYLVIDLKSFTSVECVERGLDPMKAKRQILPGQKRTNLFGGFTWHVALGVPGRCRVFEDLKARTR